MDIIRDLLDAIGLDSEEIMEKAKQVAKYGTYALISIGSLYVLIPKTKREPLILNCQELTDYCWDRSTWFSGDLGDSTFELRFVEDNGEMVGESELHLRNCHGNRPFPFMTSGRGTVKSTPIGIGMYASADIKLIQWEHTPNTFIRCPLSVAIMGKRGTHPTQEISLEKDWKDSPEALKILPFIGDPAPIEEKQWDIPIGVWTHLEFDVYEYCRRYGIQGECFLIAPGVECGRCDAEPNPSADVIYRVKNVKLELR